MDFSEKELLSSEVAERKSSYWDKVPAATESLSLSLYKSWVHDSG